MPSRFNAAVQSGRRSMLDLSTGLAPAHADGGLGGGGASGSSTACTGRTRRKREDVEVEERRHRRLASAAAAGDAAPPRRGELSEANFREAESELARRLVALRAQALGVWKRGCVELDAEAAVADGQPEHWELNSPPAQRRRRHRSANAGSIDDQQDDLSDGTAKIRKRKSLPKASSYKENSGRALAGAVGKPPHAGTSKSSLASSKTRKHRKARLEPTLPNRLSIVKTRSHRKRENTKALASLAHCSGSEDVEDTELVELVDDRFPEGESEPPEFFEDDEQDDEGEEDLAALHDVEVGVRGNELAAAEEEEEEQRVSEAEVSEEAEAYEYEEVVEEEEEEEADVDEIDAQDEEDDEGLEDEPKGIFRDSRGSGSAQALLRRGGVLPLAPQRALLRAGFLAGALARRSPASSRLGSAGAARPRAAQLRSVAAGDETERRARLRPAKGTKPVLQAAACQPPRRPCVSRYVPPHERRRQNSDVETPRLKTLSEADAVVGGPFGLGAPVAEQADRPKGPNMRVLARRFDSLLEQRGACCFNLLQKDDGVEIGDEIISAKCVVERSAWIPARAVAEASLGLGPGVKALPLVCGGRYHFEAELLTKSALVVGWSAATSLPSGFDFQSFGYASTGSLVTNHTSYEQNAYGPAFGQAGDIVGVLLDWLPEGLQVSFMLNGRRLGVAFDLSAPDALDGAGADQDRQPPLQPHLCQAPGPAFNARLRGLSEDVPLAFPTPGYKPLCALAPAHFCPFSAAVARATDLCAVRTPTVARRLIHGHLDVQLPLAHLAQERQAEGR